MAKLRRYSDNQLSFAVNMRHGSLMLLMSSLCKIISIEMPLDIMSHLLDAKWMIC